MRVALALALLLSVAASAPAQVTYQTVADFAGTGLGVPKGGVVRGPDGAFYGTATNSLNGCGGIYRLDGNGTLSALHLFTRNVDGCRPIGELVVGPDGHLYGTASEGGPTTVPLTSGRGTGTIFRISTSGQFTLLHEFAFDQARGIPPEGSLPYGSLALGGDGHFYGVNNFGGDPGPCGTVFRITAAGAFAVLRHLATLNSGCFPNAGLQLGTDGHMYGATLGTSVNGGGIFRVSTDGYRHFCGDASN